MANLYHGSASTLRPGTRLRPAQRDDIIDDDLDLGEALALYTFDHFMPVGRIPRLEAIYACSRPEDCSAMGAWGEQVYEIRPLGGVERYHAGWYKYMFDEVAFIGQEILEAQGPLTLSAAAALLPARGWPTAEMEEIAASYWEGLAESDSDHWEFLMDAAIVVRAVELPSPDLEVSSL